MWLLLNELCLLKWYLSVNELVCMDFKCNGMLIVHWTDIHNSVVWVGLYKTVLKVIDATAAKAELYSLLCSALGGSVCWRLGLLPRHCVCNEDRHGSLTFSTPAPNAEHSTNKT